MVKDSSVRLVTTCPGCGMVRALPPGPYRWKQSVTLVPCPKCGQPATFVVFWSRWAYVKRGWS